ncbi:MAG TPA: helix-turn-helix domain-containing protein, partial [Anaerolineales bacterium]
MEKDTFKVSFGEWLKRERSRLGLTQDQLALRINCSTSALRKFEAEERRPSAQVVERLAEIFEIPPDEQSNFLKYARGDWTKAPNESFVDSPWRASILFPYTNLPAATTSFIGRKNEQNEVIDLLAKSRLVTLTGAGGIGKTRLSLQVGLKLLNDYPDGLWLVELASLADPTLVPQAMITTLGLAERSSWSYLERLTNFLRIRRVLLIMDNCEHLIQACAEL